MANEWNCSSEKQTEHQKNQFREIWCHAVIRKRILCTSESTECDYFNYTVESRVFEPPRETKISAKNRIVQKCKITMFDSPGRETTFGSNYWEVRKNEGSRNPYSTENNFPSLSSMAANYISNCRLNIASLSDAKCFFFCPI